MFEALQENAGRVLAASLIAGASILAGCAHAPVPVEPASTRFFVPAQRTDTVSYADRAALAELDAEVDPVYMLGAGDHLSVQVLAAPRCRRAMWWARTAASACRWWARCAWPR